MSDGAAVEQVSNGWGLFNNRCGELGHRIALVPLRLMIGAIFIPHGLRKAFGVLGGGGFEATVAHLAELGFPGATFWAVLLIVAEIVGGAMLIVGLAPRFAAGALGIAMIVGMLTAHLGDSFFATHFQQMLIAGCATIFIAGGGALSVQPGKPRRPAPEPRGGE